jgi:hypothetical protein
MMHPRRPRRRYQEQARSLQLQRRPKILPQLKNRLIRRQPRPIP